MDQQLPPNINPRTCSEIVYYPTVCQWPCPTALQLLEADDNEDDAGTAVPPPDIKSIKRSAAESGSNQLQLSTLILQMFDLQIKARMFLVCLLCICFPSVLKNLVSQ